MAAVLSFDRICKSFGATLAVSDVSFDVEAGEVHALVGENGAGKSTLIRILAGDHRPDSGSILLKGETVAFTHPEMALAHGIGFVHQIPADVPSLSITENLALGVPFRRNWLGIIDWPAEHAAAVQDLRKVGIAADPRQPLERLGPADRALVSVARSLRRGLNVLVLDEVTASLSEPEVRTVHEKILKLKAEGISIIYVSHRLEEVFRVADRVTVMRDGRKVATRDVAGLGQKELVRLIVGSEIDHLFKRAVAAAAPRIETPRLKVSNLSDSKLRDVSFELSPGEILGIAGLGGSGRSRLLRTIFGVHPIRSGELLLDGKSIELRGASDALAHGIGMVTEDRMNDGFVAGLPIWQNVTLPWSDRFSNLGFLRLRSERTAARLGTDRVGVKMPGLNAQMTQLSGGNQQKAIFSRWVTGPIRLLLLDEPTHGVDIKSKAQIYALIRDLAGTGVSFVIVSSEIDELVALSDRILLLRDGRVDGELGGGEVNKELVLHALLSVEGGGPGDVHA